MNTEHDSRFAVAQLGFQCHSEACNHSLIAPNTEYLLYYSEAIGSFERVCINCMHRVVNTTPETYLYDCEAVRDYFEIISVYGGAE